MIGLFIYSTPYVVAAATTGLSRLALRGSTAVSVIGGRTLAANTRTAYVIGFGIVVSMILFNVPLLFASYFGDVVTRAITVNEHVNSASVMVRAPATTTPALQALIKDPSIEVLPIDFNYNSKSAEGTLVVNCETAKRLGAHNCHSGLQSVSALTKTALEASTEFTPESFIVSQSYADKEHAQFMLVSTNRQPIAQEQLNSRLFSYRINVRQVGDEWAGSATFQVHQLRWFTFFAVPGTLMLTSGFAIGAWVRLRRQILTMQPILINEPGPRMLLTITLSGLLTPLALASLIGVGASGIMNWILSQQYEGLRLQPVPILTVGATGLVVAILAWAVVSASASQTHDSLTRKVTPDA